MLESMLAMGGGGKKIYPDSGPGPIAAVGDDDVAYFGEVSNAEILSAEEFVNQIPELFGAAVLNDSMPWLKFRYYGKYLFIKKYPIFQLTTGNFQTNWASLYNAGLIYGVDGPGPYNFTTNVNQLRFVKKGAHTFKVRTITGDATETATNFDSSNSGRKDLVVRKSMFTELLYRVINEKLTGYDQKKFASFHVSDVVSNGGHEVTREIVKTGLGAGRVVMRGMGYASPGSMASYTFNLPWAALDKFERWRPVLELVGKNEVYGTKQHTLSTVGFVRGSVANVQFGAASVGTETMVLRLTDIKASRNLQKPVGVTSIAGTSGPTVLRSIQVTHKPPVRIANVSFTI
jgi:hypothetical protein